MKSRHSLESAQARTRAKFATQRRSRGRPRLDIDPEVVRQLAQVGDSAREIARYIGCNAGTILRRFGALLKAEQEYQARWGWLDENHLFAWLQQQRSDDIVFPVRLADDESDDLLAWLQDEEQNP